MAFLVDITSHLNDLNLKLQGKNKSVCDLVAAVQSFQWKLEIFKADLQENFTHFPAMKQIQGERYFLSCQVLLFIQNPFLVKNGTTLSQEAKITLKWVDMASRQMELVDLQATVVLKEQSGVSDAASFWLQTVPEESFPWSH